MIHVIEQTHEVDGAAPAPVLMAGMLTRRIAGCPMAVDVIVNGAAVAGSELQLDRPPRPLLQLQSYNLLGRALVGARNVEAILECQGGVDGLAGRHGDVVAHVPVPIWDGGEGTVGDITVGQH